MDKNIAIIIVAIIGVCIIGAFIAEGVKVHREKKWQEYIKNKRKNS